ncbi:MAG: hypothetical protein EAZ11_10395 [Curvibacter sp.]|nr:MAG: hypothetical protein EAZ11_10395 [Curvibacter sp.]
MMLFKNDIFFLHGGRYRLLHIATNEDKAWAINVDDQKAWPREFSWSQLHKLEPHNNRVPTPAAEIEKEEEGTNTESQNLQGKTYSRSRGTPTAPMLAVRDSAVKLLGDLPNRPEIFKADQRGQIVLARAQEAGCSVPTIYKHLRQFWVGGQTPAALLGNFHRCGGSSTGLTGRRGAPPEFTRDIYQLSEKDIRNFKKEIESRYLKDKRRQMTKCFQHMLEEDYETLDGNGDPFVLPEGERPTFKQFEYFLRKNYPLKVRLRSREGDKDFERDHRAVLGTVMADCLGVGHYYEADATIADVYLVASDDIRKIIGKPTIYIIIDRKSRLIVGWYVGLENASWICAMQAFFSISQDKRMLCERLGVVYDPADWPAHQVFPKQVLADRSEVLTKTSDQLAENLDVIVTTVPSKRPDWKPVIESEFKQTRMTLQAGAPGFDPPENAMARQGKRYDKDACMTLKQFEKVILEAIIAHNRRPLLDYPLSHKEFGDGVAPIPIELWNHGIVERSGLLPRYAEDSVRMALLPRSQGSVSEAGIEFENCHYSCAEAIKNGWFEIGRKKRFKVEVSFDRRLVDTIYVHDPANTGKIYTCSLTTVSERYEGFSFSEVFAIEKLKRNSNVHLKQVRTQVTADYNRKTKSVFDEAKENLKNAKLSSSRAARRADTKPAREENLRAERQELANPHVSSTQLPAKVISIRAPVPALKSDVSANEPLPPEGTSVALVTTTLTPQERIKQLKEKMLHG